MRKLTAILLAALMLLSLSACGGGGGGGSSGGDTIKIGWVGSLTGEQAAFGTCESQTLKLLVKQQNEAGGILGKQIEVICYDTKGDAQEAVNAAKRLVAQDKVCSIIGPNASGQAIAMQAVLNEYKVPDIATVATNEKVTVQDGQLQPYNFRICFIDPQQGNIAASFIYDYLKLTEAAVLMNISDDYSQGLTKIFEQTFQQKGGKIVAEEAFTGGDTEFTAQLTKIKESGAKIIFMPNSYQEIINIAKQARALGIDATILGGDAFASDVLFDAIDVLDGSYVINHLSLNDPELEDFRQQYKAEYGQDAAVEMNAYMVYDSFLLWKAAVEKAGSADSQAITDAMTQVEVQGLTGNIKISAEDHNPIGKSGCVEQVTKDGYVFITKIS